MKLTVFTLKDKEYGVDMMVTASADAVDAVKARKMGADDYYAKTSDLSILVKAIKKITEI
ncbi:MAG: hypothetical protein HQ549_03015 [Candidatus Omnitrophica bacterium]|nr:hypothetical protein [Candidatus Omnitrophota bacterium]